LLPFPFEDSITPDTGSMNGPSGRLQLGLAQLLEMDFEHARKS
jgi:hypothetical protein